MVKFGEEIVRGQIQEWQPYYIRYVRLRTLIKLMEASSSEEAYHTFFDELKLNLKRVDGFYSAQEAIAQKSVENLLGEDGPVHEEEREAMVQSITEHLGMLKSFAQFNSEGFRKITKKFDKRVVPIVPLTTPSDTMQERTLQVLKTYPFYEADERLEKLDETVQSWVKREQNLKLPALEVESYQRVASAHLNSPLLGGLSIKAKKSKRAKVLRKVYKILCSSIGIILVTIVIGVLAFLDLVPNWLHGTSYLTIWVTSVVLILLVKQLPPDGVLLTATLFLTICQVLTPEKAWAAFADDVILSVAGLGVIAHAVGGTGAIDMLFGRLLGKPSNYQVALMRLFVPSVFLNVCISNTCVMSCLIPVIDKWSVEIGFHKALFLMPLSYLLLITGAFAIFSTSTNLITQGQLKISSAKDHEDLTFGNFDIAVPIAVCTLATVAYLMIFTPIILRKYKVQKDNPDRKSETTIRQRHEVTFDLRVQIIGPVFADKTLEDSQILTCLGHHDGYVLSIERYGENLPAITSKSQLKLDDVLLVRTVCDGVVILSQTPGLFVLPLDATELISTAQRELVEVTIDTLSPIIGHRIISSTNYMVYGGSIVAYRSLDALPTPNAEDAGFVSNRRTIKGVSAMGKVANVLVLPDYQGVKATDLPHTRLRHGDQLIFSATPEFYRNWKKSGDFVVMRKLTETDSAEEESKSILPFIAGGILAVMVALVASNTLPLWEAVLSALVALCITKCTSLDSVIHAVKLRTVLTIVGAFGLGHAIGDTGVASALSHLLLSLLDPFGPLGLLVAIFASTVSLGVVFHGTAVVVLMYPICKEAASGMGIPIHQVMCVLMIAATCQMLSPISYQTNLMAYTAGDYEFTDFTKLGAGLVLTLAFVGIPMARFWFPN